MIKRDSKKGSHVGVIASFSIFILFLVGFYFAAEPALKFNKDKQALLQYLEEKIYDEFSGNFTVAIVSDTAPGNGCWNVTNSVIGVNDGSYAIVKDSNKNKLNSEYRGSTLIIQNNNEGNLWVYYSNFPFSPSSTSDSGCSAAFIESTRTTQEMFEGKIADGIVNFSVLKDKLNFPDESQFSIAFQYNNGTVIGAGDLNVTQNVYAQEKSIQYIDKSANSLAGKLTIKVW